MGKVIVVTSGKGGVGKTTATANLGVALAQNGKKVLIVDTDLGLRNLDITMGLENKIVYNLVDVVGEKCSLSDAVLENPRYPGLYLLASAQTKNQSAVSLNQMKALTENLALEYDFVLLDCPTGIEQGFHNAITGADQAIIVSTVDTSSIRDADRVINLLESNGITDIGIILNRVRMDMIHRGCAMSIDDVTDILTSPLIGIIPEDESVLIGVHKGEPIAGGSSLAGQAYSNICKRMLGQEVPFLNLNKKKSILSKFANVLTNN